MVIHETNFDHPGAILKGIEDGSIPESLDGCVVRIDAVMVERDIFEYLRNTLERIEQSDPPEFAQGMQDTIWKELYPRFSMDQKIDWAKTAIKSLVAVNGKAIVDSGLCEIKKLIERHGATSNVFGDRISSILSGLQFQRGDLPPERLANIFEIFSCIRSPSFMVTLIESAVAIYPGQYLLITDYESKVLKNSDEERLELFKRGFERSQETKRWNVVQWEKQEVCEFWAKEIFPERGDMNAFFNKGRFSIEILGISQIAPLIELLANENKIDVDNFLGIMEIAKYNETKFSTYSAKHVVDKFNSLESFLERIKLLLSVGGINVQQNKTAL